MNKTAPNPNTRRSIRRHLLVSLAVVFLLIGGVGGWATTTQIASAVIANGAIVVDSHVKKVQHLTGGVVGQVLVREGDHVREGQLLVRLDDTVTRANLAIITKALDQLRARRARLESERDGRNAILFPAVLLRHRNDPDVAHVLTGESNLFELRRSARDGQKAQLKQQIDQIKQQIDGYKAQAEAKAHEIELIKRELEGVRTLWEQKLTPMTKLTALEREAARLAGERAQLNSAVAELNGKIIETNLKIIQIDQDLASDVAKELRETDAKIDEYVERKIAAEDQLKRMDIRAPQDGTVFELTVHTVGGVIGQGETIMKIVPDNDHLAVEARIAPQDIDQVHVGERTHLRMTAFDQRSTPEVAGTVLQISADTMTDKVTGKAYYTARIGIKDDSKLPLKRFKLIPGMPVEVFIQTGDRDVLSYLTKPLRDQLTRAFRER